VVQTSRFERRPLRPSLSKGEIVAILPVLRRRNGQYSEPQPGRWSSQFRVGAKAPHNRRVQKTHLNAADQGCASARNEVPLRRLPFRDATQSAAGRSGNNRGGTLMKSRIAIAVSALTLGTALATIPSFAQTSGQPNGTNAQQGSSGCVVFQQGCSDKPYPMNNGQQAGTSQSRTTRSVSTAQRLSPQRPSSERPSGAQLNGERDRVAQDRERASGDTYGFGRPNRDYAYGRSAELGSAAHGGTEWCETRFRSFDPATGTYVGFDGIRHACP
jgi:BA14K-like protein